MTVRADNLINNYLPAGGDRLIIFLARTVIWIFGFVLLKIRDVAASYLHLEDSRSFVWFYVCPEFWQKIFFGMEIETQNYTIESTIKSNVDEFQFLTHCTARECVLSSTRAGGSRTWGQEHFWIKSFHSEENAASKNGPSLSFIKTRYHSGEENDTFNRGK